MVRVATPPRWGPGGVGYENSYSPFLGDDASSGAGAELDVYSNYNNVVSPASGGVLAEEEEEHAHADDGTTMVHEEDCAYAAFEAFEAMEGMPPQMLAVGACTSSESS